MRDLSKEELVNINRILYLARVSISDFCINDCKAKCCKVGKLILLNDDEINFMTNGNVDMFLKNGVLCRTEQGNYTFNHSKFKCPFLKDDNTCSVWKDLRRPQVCKDFPLFFVQNKFIFTADICPAIKNGMLNSYLKKLEKFGLKIINV